MTNSSYIKEHTIIMNELVLLDFNNFSLERFTKVQGILQPTETNITPKSHTRSASNLNSIIDSRRLKSKTTTSSRVLSKDPTDRIEFARKVVNSTLSILDSWKANQSEQSKPKTLTSKKYLYESASLAFSALYEKNSDTQDPLSVEKRHVSFILKLIDVQMIDQAWKELGFLSKSLLSQLDNSNNKLDSNDFAAALLSIPIPSNASESLASIITLSQIALLKALSKYSKKQAKPIASAVCINN